MSNKITKTDTKLTEATTFAIPEDYDLGIQSDDVKTPAILLWQKMSDMVEFEDENVKAGDFVNPVSGEVLGNSFEAVIIKPFVTVRKFGEPDKDTGRASIVQFSRDGIHWDNGERIQPSEFQWKEDKSHALKSFHYLVLVKGSNMPAIVTFKGASAKFAKTLNANLMYQRPCWRSWFKFFSAVEEKGGNKYHIVQSKAQPKNLVDEETANMCMEFYNKGMVSSPEMEKEFDGDSVDFK